MNGFLILDKPEGLTSAQSVYKLRTKLGIRKIGHCGTLDPLATGLLPVCIGEATKFSNFASDLDKVYEESRPVYAALSLNNLQLKSFLKNL